MWAPDVSFRRHRPPWQPPSGHAAPCPAVPWRCDPRVPAAGRGLSLLLGKLFLSLQLLVRIFSSISKFFFIISDSYKTVGFCWEQLYCCMNTLVTICVSETCSKAFQAATQTNQVKNTPEVPTDNMRCIHRNSSMQDTPTTRVLSGWQLPKFGAFCHHKHVGSQTQPCIALLAVQNFRTTRALPQQPGKNPEQQELQPLCAVRIKWVRDTIYLQPVLQPSCMQHQGSRSRR